MCGAADREDMAAPAPARTRHGPPARVFDLNRAQ